MALETPPPFNGKSHKNDHFFWRAFGMMKLYFACAEVYAITGKKFTTENKVQVMWPNFPCKQNCYPKILIEICTYIDRKFQSIH